MVDIILIRDLAASTGSPAPPDVRAAIEDIFAARASEAEATGRTPQMLPAVVKAYPHWKSDYEAAAAASVGVDLALKDAVQAVNDWIDSICE